VCGNRTVGEESGRIAASSHAEGIPSPGWGLKCEMQHDHQEGRNAQRSGVVVKA